jgi:Sulfotransferase family
VERGPVFVAGLERSGTSLLYALLASHPNIAMTRRTNLWRHFFDQHGDLAEAENLDRCLTAMSRYKRLVVLDVDFARLRREFLTGPRTYPRLFALLEEQVAQRMGRPRWGDKSLHTEHHADDIFEAYPGARILHMIRDPRDRYASSYARWRVRRGGVGAGTAEWLSSARLASRNVRRYPDRYLIVPYETLATEPDASLARICVFIDEPFVREMLSMSGAPEFRASGNSSYGKRTAGVISTGSIGRFRDVLSSRQIAFIQFLAGREMAAFGYERDPVRLPLADGLRFALVDVPVQWAHLMIWTARERVRDRRGRPLPADRLVDRERAA